MQGDLVMFENKAYEGLSKDEKKFLKKTEKLMKKIEKDSIEIDETIETVSSVIKEVDKGWEQLKI